MSESCELNTYLQKIAEVAEVLASRGWAEGGAGNISVLLPHSGFSSNFPEAQIPLPGAYPQLAGKMFLFTHSGSRMRHIAKNPQAHVCLACVNEEGSVLSCFTENARPTGEYLMHLDVYQKQPAACAIVHAHTTFSSMLPSLVKDCSQALVTAHTEIPWILPKGVKILPLLPPCSSALAHSAAEVAGNCSGMIIEKHGALSFGKDLDSALDRIEVIEKASHIIWLQSVCGKLDTNATWKKEFLPPEA